MRYVYLDHAATTAMRPEVREAMLPFLEERFGNPSSVHRYGRHARNALEQARERLAAALGANRREVVFTGGGTEADNLAVLGRWRRQCNGGRDGVIVTTAIEHKAVAGAAAQAASEGAELIVLGVDEDGRLDPDSVSEALRASPCVVSVMWGNNEVGTVQPVAEVAALCRAEGVVFHSDAVQAFGKVRVRVDEVPCDLLSLSGHKLGGPKGIGALYVRDGVEVLPLTHGGGQERALRPGTENVAAAVGLALAAELAAAEQADEHARLVVLRRRLEQGVLAGIAGVAVNAGGAERLPHVSSFSVSSADQEAVIVGLDLEGLAASGGSACQSGTVHSSHVLSAMGRARPGEAVVRLSLGRDTTEADIEFAIRAFATVVERVRQESGG